MSTNWGNTHWGSPQLTAGTAIMVAGGASVTSATQPLNSAYTYGSAGAAMFTTFQARESANLTDFWIRVSSYTGTWGSTDGKIKVEIREGLNGTGIPGTTLTASFDVTLDGSTTGWIKKSGLSISLTAGKIYCIVIGDPDGGGTNYVTVVAGYGSSLVVVPMVSDSAVRTTTNGFSTAASGGTPAMCYVAKIGSQLICGSGYDTRATTASSTNERGLRFQVPEKCTLIGVRWPTDGAAAFGSHAFKLYSGSTNPGGSTVKTWASVASTLASGTTPLPSTYMFPSADWVDLDAGTTYRMVFDPASNQTVPRKSTVGGSPDADVKAALGGGNGQWYWTEESGGAWSDDAASYPEFTPILVPATAAGSLLVNPGMDGGMS